MGNPKKKFSKQRRNKRAANWKLVRPNLQPCPRCHEPKLPHHACSNCGTYNSRQVIVQEQES